MIPGVPPQQVLNPQELKLLRFFKQLGEQDQQTLLRFAAFLHDSPADSASQAQAEGEQQELQLPVAIEAKPNESVIGAIKRLGKTYPMIDKSSLLNETSDFMTQHLVQGQDAATVIKGLESLFADAYQSYKETWQKNHGG